MPSPFPGMDSYLEEPARWPDAHQRLITYIADALQPQVRPRYHARMGERMYILQPPRAMDPDVILTQRPVREPAPVDVGTATPQVANENPSFLQRNGPSRGTASPHDAFDANSDASFIPVGETARRAPGPAVGPPRAL